jgi:hypothetical protein
MHPIVIFLTPIFVFFFSSLFSRELLLVSNFAAMFATLYFALGDTLTKAAEEQRAEIAKRQDELSDFEIEQLQALIQAHELNIEQ